MQISWIVAALLAASSLSSFAQDAQQKAAEASPTDQNLILDTLKRIDEAERGKDVATIRDTGWPAATFSIRAYGQPLSRAEKRNWGEPVFSGRGVSSQVRYDRPRISWAGNRVMITTRGRGNFLCLNGDGQFVPDGSHFIEYNSIVMERRERDWRILTWDRAVLRLKTSSFRRC